MRLLAALIRLLLWPLLAAVWTAGQLLRVLCYAIGFLPVRLAVLGLIVYAAATEPMPAGAFFGASLGWTLLSYLAGKLAPRLRMGSLPRPWRAVPRRAAAPERARPAATAPPVSPSGPEPERRGPNLPSPSFVRPAVLMPNGTPLSEAAMIAGLDPALQKLLPGVPGRSP